MDKKFKETIKSIVAFIKTQDNFLITSHVNADGDAYASLLSVAYMLNQWNKAYKIIIHDREPEEKYAFMWGFEDIRSYSAAFDGKFDAAIAVDVPSRERIGDPALLLPSPGACVKIDHHPEEEKFAEYNLVSTRASSTSQLVFEIVTEAGIDMTHDLAVLIFSGIMYDTGRFSFSNTNVRDFEIAAHLLRFEVQPSKIADQIFFTNSFQSMKTIGYALDRMESLLEGKLAIIFLPLHVVQKNHPSEIEELANYSIAIKDVEVGLFIREVEPNFYKVSFRSKGRVNVNVIAKVFGGGGHDHAAGCRYQGDYENLKTRLIEEIRKHL
ncbi:MAG: bifunctional oligoribonuclease/PAP phosphatase NrnA [Calditrichia bacterium]